MGIYVNPGIDVLLADMRQEIYVDKSMIMTELNKVFGTSTLSRMCVSRPRRFGKTMVGNLISAYYTRGADSHVVFDRLELSKHENWDEWLNKCNVIKIDLGSFFSQYRERGSVIKNMANDVIDDMRREFPEAKIRKSWPLPKAIVNVFNITRVPFVLIIDEYDVMVREQVSEKEFQSYLELLNGLFKGAECGEAIGLAYITGIMPIVRDRVQSKLNNFTEYTMLEPLDLAPYVGFTIDEVQALCDKHKMDYDECLRWYDGYHIDPEVSICNSNSVCKAISTRKFANYWNRTGAYSVISDHVSMDFDGIKQDLSKMVGGGSVPVKVTTFTNVLSDLGNKDKVFTYLIHLGYLAYNQKKKECYIPNGEIRDEWESALEDMKDMSKTVEMIRNSERLLKATLERDEQAVADALDKAHEYVTSAQTYNDEGALQSAVGLAYFSATSQYDIKKELAAGFGYAGIGFLPYVQGAPGIIIELKMDQAPEVGLAQIKEKRYADALKGYRGPVYLVAVSYGKESKKHICKIEVIEKQ